MIKIIAGLGNPGKEYEDTRHNVGYKVLDLLKEKLNASSCGSKFKAEVSEVDPTWGKVFLFKSLTFMNESGKPLGEFARFYKIPSTQVLVVFDEVDLPVGNLRLSESGTSGHQGVKSVIENLGADFLRLRIGIGDNRSVGIPSEDYVLQNFKPEEKPLIEKAIEKATDLVPEILQGNLDQVRQSIADFNQTLNA